MPSAGLRFAGEAAFLVLVALGLALAGIDPTVIGVVVLVGLGLVAFLEWARMKEGARAGEPDETGQPPMPPPHVERINVEPAAGAESQPARDPEPELKAAVDERSARAILASAAPPPPPAKPRGARSGAERRPAPRRAAPPPPPPDSEPLPVATGPPRTWNLWELQRAARESPDDERREEWSALLIHLREFANADGDLPAEFDGLVRESFGLLLAAQREPAAAP